MRQESWHMLRPRQILVPIIFAMMFGYFGYHLVNGDRGLLAMAHLQRETMIADQNLAEAETTRKIWEVDRKSTRLNSSHQIISYAVFCLKKKKNMIIIRNNTSTMIAAAVNASNHR